jgi:hypothetical protein
VKETTLPKLRTSSRCPTCRVRHVVDIEVVAEARPLGTFSLAGAQMKASMRYAFRYKCTACPANGPAEGPGGLAPESLLGLPVESCGHVAATTHATAGTHRLDVCPGCCEACRAAHAAMKGEVG